MATLAHSASASSPTRRRWPLGTILAALGAAMVLAALSAWGGAARPGPLLGVGIALMSASVAGFALLTWWLYLSPLASTRAAGSSVSPLFVQRVALLAALGGLGTEVAAVWDDDWHRRFGGFGDDFLWPPHLLIYSSLGFIAACGIGSLALTLRGQGGVRRRFRAEPAIGLVGLVAAFMVVLLPSDEVWHRLYGLDITAWSPPHLLAAVNFSLVLLASAAAQVSLLPQPRGWSTIGRLGRAEVIVLVTLALGTVQLLQIGTTEWDGQSVIGRTAGTGFAAAFNARPEWVYPVVLVCIGVFIGQLSIHALQRPGAATLVGLIVVAFRLVSLTALDAWQPAIGMSAVSHLLILPALVVLDLWYLYRLRNADAPSSVLVGSLIASLALLAVALPVIPVVLPSPRIAAEMLVPTALFGILVALWAGYSGAHLAGWLRSFSARKPVN